MDPKFAELLARLDDADNPLTDEELADLQSQIVEVAKGIDPANASDEDIEVLAEAKEAKEKVDAEISTRTEAATERANQAQELLNAVIKDETPPEEVPGATDPSDNPDDPEVVVPDPEVVEPEVAPTSEQVQEPVAASAAVTTPRLPSISHLARRQPVSHKPVDSKTSMKTLTASAEMPGLSAGTEVDVEQWATSVSRKIEAMFKVNNGIGDGEKVYFGSVHAEYPEDRQLGMDAYENEEKIDAVTSEEALVASGGVCGPVGVDYNVAGPTQAGRPVRDSLAQFQANRGGLRYILPFKLSSIAALGATVSPVSIWTASNDATPSSPTTKPHATFTCQAVQESYVDAITNIVQFGNFQARFFPEQIAQFMEVVDAWHARTAEATILKAIADGSTATTADINLLGATRDVLSSIDRAAAAMRYRNRMAPNAPLRLIYPLWLNAEIRADLARQMPGDNTYAVTDAQIAEMWRARNINVTFAQDSPTSAAVTQGFPVQGAGMLVPWPTKVIMHLFPEGTWMFLDGGELNLGMVRDATLNATNDFQMFSETLEKAIFRGVESLQITADICASGQAANTVDTSSLCNSGS